MTCETCDSGTAVIWGGGQHYECAEIKEMGIGTKYNTHPAHQVMSHAGKVYVPKCCPKKRAEKVGDCY